MVSGRALEYQILSRLSVSDVPLGATALYIDLGRSLGIGQATIGRKLAEMDRAGLTQRVQNKGRVVTQHGRRMAEQLFLRLSKEEDHEALAQAISEPTPERLLQVLEGREVLETEIARLAAARANAEAVDRIREALARQAVSLSNGSAGTDEDVAVHDAIADACGNEVLKQLLKLLRRESYLSSMVALMRRSIGGRLAYEHETILRAIESHDQEGAAAAMREHLRGLRRDVRAFWDGPEEVLQACDGGESTK